MLNTAISAWQIAHWDILGKLLGVPIYNSPGGAARGAVLSRSTRDLDELKEMTDIPVFSTGFQPSGPCKSESTGMRLFDWGTPLFCREISYWPLMKRPFSFRPRSQTR